MANPQGLQIAQVLADLNDLQFADPDAALTLVTADKTLGQIRRRSKPSLFTTPSQQSTSGTPTLSRTSSKMSGTRASSSAGKSGAIAARMPLRRGDSSVLKEDGSEIDADMNRARILLGLYDARESLTQQDMAGLEKARANVATIGAKYYNLAGAQHRGH